MQFNSLIFRHNTLLLTCQSCRRLSLTSAHSKTSSYSNMIRRFLIDGNQTKKKRKWHDPKLILMNPTALAQPLGKGDKDSHRLHVLNKVFLDKICDILSTGNISPLISGHGFEISKVKVLPNMSGVNVYWICTGSSVDDKVEEILKENAHMLRYELSQLRVIGRVPPITFVRDHRHYKLLEVEKRLAIADYGEDFEPTDPMHRVKSHKVLKLKLDDEIKSALLDQEKEESTQDFFLQAVRLNSQQSAETENPELVNLPADLPQMRNNILGVDTEKLFKLVKQSMAKARAEHRKNAEELPMYDLHSQPDVPVHRSASRAEEIRRWVTKYEQLRRKQKRRQNKELDLHSVPSKCEDDDYPELVGAWVEEDFLEENFEVIGDEQKV